jgi:ABC-type sugar transport system ATPase subunit
MNKVVPDESSSGTTFPQTIGWRQMTDYLVQMVNISKSYPGVHALDSVSFDLQPGEVHCLVGENGAGKSTLMKILSGAENADKGEIILSGQKFSGYDPVTAHDLGIAAIYQETDLVPLLSVARNIFLGHEPVYSWKGINRRGLKQDTLDLMKKIDLDLSPDELVENLTPANRQLVQILKALSYNSKILIMDEPGAVLSDYELERLFVLLGQLKKQGIGIIYISHRLEEILQIGDRVTVLRDGAHITTNNTKDITVDKIIEYMVGRPLGEQYGKVPAFTNDVVMSVRGLTVKGQFENISFDLHKGEILSLAGLIGAGRSEVLSCLFGLTPADKGEVLINGKPVVIKSPKAAMDIGLGLVPEDRRESGLVVNRNVQENITLTVIDSMGKWLGLDRKKANRLADTYIKQLDIKTPSIYQLVRNLSGGNQQKIVISKWLAANTQILLMDEPTRGVDVNAKAEIYRTMNDLARQGVSMIMASSELPEVLGMSDRILVMAGGHITKEFPVDKANQVEIMKYAVPPSALNQGLRTNGDLHIGGSN